MTCVRLRPRARPAALKAWTAGTARPDEACDVVASDPHGHEARFDMPEWDDMVLVGRIVRPHGIRGDVVVEPFTDFVEERFRPASTVWTRTPEGQVLPIVLRAARVQAGRVVVAFEGRIRIEDVEPLVGLELRVPEQELRPLGAGMYYHHQLVGCTVETTEGEGVGRVTRVEGGAAGSLLVVEGARGEILIPLAADICVDIDPARRRIRINPPEGLLDLNEPAVSASDRARWVRSRRRWRQGR